METEQTRLDVVPRPPALKQRVWRLVLGGKDQRNIESRARFPRRHHFFRREVFDTHQAQWPRDITKVGLGDLVRRGPRRQHPGRWIALLQKVFRILMDDNVIAVRQIVFRREPVGWIPE